MNTPRENAAQRALQRLTEKAAIRPASYFIKGITEGNRTVLSEAITLIESSHPKHRKTAHQILLGCIPHSGNSIRIGITGVPGVGKSSFIETFGSLLTSLGKKVAVLAIDPSSSISHGSILGDKTRMEKLSVDEMAFIRPSPAADNLGGVARKTKESMMLCEAAGYNIILIETVGVGQSETAVHDMTDFFLLLMLAGAGDQLQGIKRGIMEMCDALAITKADGENTKAATRALAEYKSALHFYPPKESGWTPRVMTCSATENKGISEIWDAVEAHHRWHSERNAFSRKREEQDVKWMLNTVKDAILGRYFENPKFTAELRNLELQIKEKKTTPFQAAEKLLSRF